LNTIEDEAHGFLHFTLGDVGGNVVMMAVKSPMEDYGFSYSNIASLAISAQAFFKIDIIIKKLLAIKFYHRVNCTADP
jgi:hypothetical protein